MGKSSITTHVAGRIPNELMRLKTADETPSEFLIRAVVSLRDRKPQAVIPDGKEHSLLIKMVKVFAKQGIKMVLEPEEVEIVKRLFQE